MTKKHMTHATAPTVTESQGINLINQLLEKAKVILQNRVDENSSEAWENLAENFLIKIFGSDSPNVRKVTGIGKTGSFPMNAGESWWENHRRETLISQISMLNSLVEILQAEIQLTSGHQVKMPHQSGEKIFIVHGHDGGLLETVARFSEKLELDTIVLKEKPSHGRTIVEKFEDECRDVGFAIVLMTGDDRGGPQKVLYEQQMPRARQNVILELGFFLGRLGRNRVVVLYQEGVEIPSDYAGVIFVKLDDASAWRLHVAKELKAAGLNIDMNKAF